MAAEDAEVKARAQLEEEARRADRIQQGLPPTDDFGAPVGARCCDVVLFGQAGWCEDASSVYTAAYQATHRGIQSTIESIGAMRGGAVDEPPHSAEAERQVLLAADDGESKSGHASSP